MAGEDSEIPHARERLAEGSARNEMLALAGVSLLVSLLTTALGHGLGALPSLGVYFDGHFYIDIARSFPLPYDADARDYMSHAPGYAGLIALGRLLTPDLVNWGALAVVSAWVSGAGATLVFYLLCREVSVPAFQASLAFVLINPAWSLVSSAPHSEPLAMAFVLLCFVAHLRDSIGWSVVWLSLAMLTRYPAVLLGVVLAFDLLVVKRRFNVKTFAWLSVPLLVFGVYNLYLAWRMPGFGGLLSVHEVHWDAGLAIPFSAMVDYFGKSERAGAQGATILATAALYTLASIVGFRRSQRDYWFLAVWVLVVHAFHISLSGILGVVSFTRLALLAWPAALLIVWRLRPRPVPVVAFVALCAVAGATSIYLSQRQIAVAVYFQSRNEWLKFKATELDADEPDWIDFVALSKGEYAAPKTPQEILEHRPEF